MLVIFLNYFSLYVLRRSVIESGARPGTKPTAVILLPLPPNTEVAGLCGHP